MSITASYYLYTQEITIQQQQIKPCVPWRTRTWVLPFEVPQIKITENYEKLPRSKFRVKCAQFLSTRARHVKVHRNLTSSFQVRVIFKSQRNLITYRGDHTHIPAKLYQFPICSITISHRQTQLKLLRQHGWHPGNNFSHNIW